MALDNLWLNASNTTSPKPLLSQSSGVVDSPSTLHTLFIVCSHDLPTQLSKIHRVLSKEMPAKAVESMALPRSKP